MSVEEARTLVFLNRHFEQDEFLAALDRLILEVKAEMPCYDGDGERGWNAELKAYTEVACPTCQARAEKVEA